jgi:hypothetical protein
MTKAQVKTEFEKHGITVLQIVRNYGGFKVSINWRDYLKYQNTKLVDLAKVVLR